MFHEPLVVHLLPVNAKGGEVLTIPLQTPTLRWTVVETTGVILEHTEKKHLLWRLLGFTSYLKLMVIPSFSPGRSIFVDRNKEEMVEEPDVNSAVDIQSIVGFQVNE